MLADGADAIRPVLQSYLIESKGLYEAVKDYLAISYKKLFGWIESEVLKFQRLSVGDWKLHPITEQTFPQDYI